MRDEEEKKFEETTRLSSEEVNKQARNKRVDDITGGIDLGQLKTDVDNLKDKENDLENRVSNLENSQQEQDIKIKELENLANSNKENLLETMKDIDAEIKPALERNRKDIDKLLENDLTHTQQESLLNLQIIELREKDTAQDTEIENIKTQIENVTTNGVTHAEFNEYKTEVTNNFNTVNETNDKQNKEISELQNKNNEIESAIQGIQSQIAELTIEEITTVDIDAYWTEIFGG